MSEYSMSKAASPPLHILKVASPAAALKLDTDFGGKLFGTGFAVFRLRKNMARQLGDA